MGGFTIGGGTGEKKRTKEVSGKNLGGWKKGLAKSQGNKLPSHPRGTNGILQEKKGERGALGGKEKVAIKNPANRAPEFGKKGNEKKNVIVESKIRTEGGGKKL